jgi:hypothetical protein
MIMVIKRVKSPAVITNAELLEKIGIAIALSHRDL